MSEAFIVDAHMHVGAPGVFFSPQSEADEFLALADKLGIQHGICMDSPSVFEGGWVGLDRLCGLHEGSGGRIHYLCVFNPTETRASVEALEKAATRPGFAGLKIHPSIHGVPAEDERYDAAWRFAAERDLPILTHSWSASSYNPVQQLSTPQRFAKFVERYPGVRFVLGHFGGRGTGRQEAARMINDSPNVYGDFSGDIFDDLLIESLVASVPEDRILFGSDYPWLDPRANLTRVFLADVEESAKRRILRDNAMRVYGLEESQGS